MIVFLLVEADGHHLIGQIHEQLEMAVQNLRRGADGFIRLDAAVGPDLEGQAIVIGLLTNAGVFDGIVHLADRRKDGIRRDDPDGRIGILVVRCAHIAAALFQGQVHDEIGVLVEGGDVQIAVHNLDLIVHREGGRSQLTGTLDVDRHRLGTIAIQLSGKLFQVEDDLCNVLFHAGNGGKLMLDALNADAGNGNARQRAQQHATQGISQRLAKAMLKRLYDKLAVAVAGFHTFDAGLFDFDHWADSSSQLP